MTADPRTEPEPTGPEDRGASDDGSIAVRWQSSYDKAEVERFLDEVKLERERLEHEIAAVERRIVIATTRAASREKDAQASLGALVLAAQHELAEIEREHAEIVAAIRASAEAEARRLLDAAQTEAAAMREAAASLASNLGPGMSAVPRIVSAADDGIVVEAGQVDAG